MSIVGIDLGTTNSLISYFTDDGPQLIPNALGNVLTPSAIGLSDNGQILVGQAAKDRLGYTSKAHTSPLQTVYGDELGAKTWRKTL